MRFKWRKEQFVYLQFYKLHKNERTQFFRYIRMSILSISSITKWPSYWNVESVENMPVSWVSLVSDSGFKTHIPAHILLSNSRVVRWLKTVLIRNIHCLLLSRAAAATLVLLSSSKANLLLLFHLNYKPYFLNKVEFEKTKCVKQKLLEIFDFLIIQVRIKHPREFYY